MKDRFASPPRSVCIVMMSAIGDTVHVLPVVNALKRAWPDTTISWIIQPLPHVLVRDHPAVDEYLLFHRGRGVAGWAGFSQLAAQLKERRFDLVLALQVYLKAGIVTGLLSAEVKLGFDRARARDLNWVFTNERIPAHDPQHVQDQYFEFLEYLGVDPEPVVWGIRLTDEELAAQSRFFGEIDRPTCAVVVGSSDRARNWTAEGYARAIETMESVHGLQPILVGGPSAGEREMADRIASMTKAHPIDTLGDDLRKLVWLLDGSALTLSPDTGPLHISRALDTPVVGLYGHTNPKRAGPFRAYYDLVVDGYAEFPGEEYPVSPARRDGLGRITVDMVLEKIQVAMDKYVGQT
ncbi:MAG: glycosyltransferase family 9 protein [Gemmatimonadota bacterium]|nr:MAG: glycosyltransferase family 9 protein [Gemmatimonadota bacterium]